MFEEHKYEELKKLGTELHIPICEAFWKLEVFDKDSNLVKEHKQRSHSWVRNAYNLLFSTMAMKDGDDSTFAAGKLSIKDTGGVVRYGDFPICMYYLLSHDASAGDVGCIAAAGDDTRGIVIGTGSTAESFEDYALATAIANGVAATQISYIASNAPAITYTAGTKVLKNDLIRYFNNNSGGSIVVAEVGLITRSLVGSSHREWLQARDLLGATVTVADTGQLKATYTIQITYPS